MTPLALLAALVAASGPVAQAHGITIVAPERWVAAREGTTFVFTAPEKDAELRVDLFEKKAAGDARACVDQIVEKLAAADKVSKDEYRPATVDGQPAATHVLGVDGRRNKQLRVVGCNGRSYFLIDWLALGRGLTRHEEAFADLLTRVRYAAPAKAEPKVKRKPEARPATPDPLAPLSSPDAGR